MTKKTTQQAFDADVAQLIQLVTHSIYSNKDVFLRELIANANDAIQKAKIYAAQDTKYLWKETELEILVSLDEKKNTITIEDTWVWMSREDVTNNLWTIAKSWTKAFLEWMKDAKESGWDLIGQFGIGFYSAFMVADTVTVETKKMWEDAVLWTSDGKWTYDLWESKKENRGTIITLHITEDAKEYLAEDRLRKLILTHANYVPVPVKMNGEQVNAMRSVWSKQKSEVTKEEYNKFYTAFTFDQSEPLDTIHLHIEWMVNFKALLYIPKNPPIFGHIDAEQDYGPSLYVQNVMIMERSKELLPVWLRFVRGVVETPDLPLNVSRELIQSSSVLEKIQKTLVKEVLKSLVWLAWNERDTYAEFYSHYNRYLKEGIHYDFDNKDTIAWTLLFHSWKQEKDVTIQEYIWEWFTKDSPEVKEWETPVEKAPVYHLIWNSLSELKASPYLEQFDWSDQDVLLMVDPIDERVVQALTSFHGYPLRSAMNANVDTPKDEKKEKELEKKTEENKEFLDFVNETIWEKVEWVFLSHRLKSSPSMLVTKDGQSSAQMERIMESMGQQVSKWTRTLELNADHPLVEKMITAFAADKKSDETKDIVLYAYEQAVLLEWGVLEDMTWFLQRSNRLIGK